MLSSFPPPAPEIKGSKPKISSSRGARGSFQDISQYPDRHRPLQHDCSAEGGRSGSPVLDGLRGCGILYLLCSGHYHDLRRRSLFSGNRGGRTFLHRHRSLLCRALERHSGGGRIIPLRPACLRGRVGLLYRMGPSSGLYPDPCHQRLFRGALPGILLSCLQDQPPGQCHLHRPFDPGSCHPQTSSGSRSLPGSA